MATRTAEAFAVSVAACSGEQPRRHGREWRCRCPVHEAAGDHSPSLAVWQNGTTVRFKCMTGCPKPLVIAALKKMGVDTGYAGAATPEEQEIARRAVRQRRIEGMTKARNLYDASVPIAPGSAVYNYLKSRCLVPTDDEKETLFDAGGAFAGVLVDLRTLRTSNIQATGIQLLSLNGDGTPFVNTDGRKRRQIVGTMTGSAVPIGDFSYSNHLVIAEGIESAMAARRLYNARCACAVLSAGNYGSLLLPTWINKVTIAADNDDAGLKGARVLFGQLRAVGVETIIQYWGSGGGWDAADEWLKPSGCVGKMHG